MEMHADLRVIRHAKACLELLYDLKARVGQERRHGAENLAVQKVLASYAEWCFESGVANMTLLHHGLWQSVILLERPIMEYSIRAEYAAANPDYALWCVEIAGPESYNRENAPEMSEAEASRWRAALHQNKTTYRHLTKASRELRGLPAFESIEFGEMANAAMGTDCERAFYRRRSKLLHGDAGAFMLFSHQMPSFANLGVLNTMMWLLRLCRVLSTWLEHPRKPYERLRALSNEHQALQRHYESTSHAA